jgi:hypothetical protein
MPLEDEAVPTPRQITRQVERMLASPVFAEAEIQAKLLDHLVTKALAGEEVTEQTVIADLFPIYSGTDSAIVRVHKKNLIGRIEEYYAYCGGEALVLISVPTKPRKKGYKPPPGEAYRPSFRYNPHHPADQDYRRGIYHLAQCAPGDDGIALDCFSSVIKREPNHALAHTGIADVHLRRALYYHTQITPSVSLRKSEESALKAIDCDPSQWRPHAVQGSIECFHGRWDKARAAFSLALQCDAHHTRYGGWYYPAFRLAQGHPQEALHLAEIRARENPHDAHAQVLWGIFLYLSRRFDDAMMALAVGETMNIRHWLTHLAIALLALARNEPSAARIVLANQLLGEDLFPGLLAFCIAAELKLRKSPEEWGPSRTHAKDSLLAPIYAALDELIDTLPQPSEQLANLLKRSRKKYVSPFQLALAYLAINDSRQAIRCLKRACAEHYPLCAWLQTFPLFDGLKDHQAFQELRRPVRRPSA